MFGSDIGMNHIEEINIIRNGGNYGWMKREGYFENGMIRPGGNLNQLYPLPDDVANGRNKDEFVDLMNGLKLSPPKRIQAAVPANRELGLGKGPDQTSGRFPEWDGDEAARQQGQVRVIDVREQHEFEG